MLESTSTRLCDKPNAHWRSPDKHPAARIATLVAAGELSIPMTTGLLVGIGETRRERIETLLTIRELQRRFGHIQEVIVQNFRAKPGTRMANHAEPYHEDFLWTIAAARLVLGAGMSIQAPPNLARGDLDTLIRAGINDWGGVSPVTPDHVNPEAPWPELIRLEEQTARANRTLAQRLAIVPGFARDPERWVDPALQTAVRRNCDSTGHARSDDWYAGQATQPPSEDAALIRSKAPVRSRLSPLLGRAQRGERLESREIATLFDADGSDFTAVVRAADELRADVAGDDVTHVVNRNINYTNICQYTCSFCAFAKGRSIIARAGLRSGSGRNIAAVSRGVGAWRD
jgi:FO synthase